MTTVGDVVRTVEERFPASWAEEWDAVGLLAGDAAAEVGRVLVTLDPTPEAVGRAAAEGCRLLYSHHPVFLQPPKRLTPGAGPGGVVFAALAAGVSLAAAHTNLDRGPLAADALVSALGLPPGTPLETGAEPAALVTVYVPAAAREGVSSAMAAAGAGRIGEYSGCSFAAEGVGEYVPGASSRPYAGEPGRRERAEEVRLEMVCPKGRVQAVLEAAAGAHPYEEPLVTVVDGAFRRGAARLGRLCELPEPVTLRGLAEQVAEGLHVLPTVWGEPEGRVGRVAVATGSGGSLVADAVRRGASALISGELRYHEALEARGAGLALIEVGHDASEWPLVPVLAEAVLATPDLEAASVLVDGPSVQWWNP